MHNVASRGHVIYVGVCYAGMEVDQFISERTQHNELGGSPLKVYYQRTVSSYIKL